MTLQEIKTAVDKGKHVQWKSEAYKVTKSGIYYHITCTLNGSIIGLTWQNGVTMNGEEKDFILIN